MAADLETGGPERTDEELVQLLREDRAQEALVGLQERYGERILHFVQGMLRDAHLAQDVTQDVFQKVYAKHELYRPGTNFRAWLFEVARNQALTALRARRRTPRPVSSLGGDTSDDRGDLLDRLAAPEDDRALEEAEFMEAFHQAVDELPEHYQVVFDLCVRRGMAYSEAGSELNLPTGTVAIRIMRARKKLFGALSRHLDRLRRPPACFQ